MLNVTHVSRCQLTHRSNPPGIQHMTHTSPYAASLSCWDEDCTQLHLGFQATAYEAHSINLFVYWGFWTVCVAQLDFPLWGSSLNFMDSIFLFLFWASAIFFRSRDWSQISQSVFLNCSRDFVSVSLAPLNCRLFWSESSILRKGEPRLFTVSHDAHSPWLLFMEVGYVKNLVRIQTSCGNILI